MEGGTSEDRRTVCSWPRLQGWLFYIVPIPSRFLTKPRYTFHGMAVKMALTQLQPPRALRLPESVRLKGCLTFLKSYKGSSAHPAESWQDGRGGLFRSMKCGCCSLPYFSRNSEIRPSSLGHYEKKISSLHQIGKREKHELAQIFFLWKHCMSLFNLDSLTAWKIIPWKLNKYHGKFCFVQEIELLCNPTVATRGHQEVRLH